MKMLYLLVLFSSICIIKSTLRGFTSNKECTDFQGTEESKQAFSKDFCRTLILQDSSNKCCYIKYEVGEKTYFNCAELSIQQFYDIKAAKDTFRRKLGASKVKSLECDSSSYLYTSLLLILIFLF